MRTTTMMLQTLMPVPLPLPIGRNQPPIRPFVSPLS
jgi:hypothetical protein